MVNINHRQRSAVKQCASEKISCGIHGITETYTGQCFTLRVIDFSAEIAENVRKYGIFRKLWKLFVKLHLCSGRFWELCTIIHSFFCLL